jgi:hypothetical protein
LEGELKIPDFPKLTTLIIGSESLTSIKFINCPNLVDVDVTSCPELKSVEFHNSGSQPIYQLFTKIREKAWDGAWELRSEITSSLEEEKSELQKNIFSLREKNRLDSKEIEKLNKRNQILEKENQELSKQLEEMKFETVDLERKIEIKKSQLKRTKSDLESKLTDDFQKNTLETLLVSQEQIIRLEGTSPQLISLSEKQFKKAQEKLKSKLSEEELKKICQIQTELTRLEIQQEELQETKIEVNIK